MSTEILRQKEIRVLVVAPHNVVKNYCFEEWIARIKNLTYANYDILIADNSPSTKNKKMITKHGVNCVYVKPKQKANQQYIAESHDILRVYALRAGYDFMLHIESDVFPPHDIIERLLVHRKKIVSAPYFIDFGDKSHLMLQNIENLGGTLKHTTNIEEGHDIQIMDGQLHEVYSVGLGCCLMHRSILEKIKFRWEDGSDSHPDSFFAGDIKMIGEKQYLDTSILCEHKNSSWSTVTDRFIK